MHCPGTYRKRFSPSTAFTPGKHRLPLTLIIFGLLHHFAEDFLQLFHRLRPIAIVKILPPRPTAEISVRANY